MSSLVLCEDAYEGIDGSHKDLLRFENRSWHEIGDIEMVQ